MFRKDEYNRYVKAAEEIYNKSFQDRDFPYSRYTVNNRQKIDDAIAYILLIPITERTDTDLQLLLKYYQAAGLPHVKFEHMKDYHFTEVEPYRENAVSLQRKIWEKNKNKGEAKKLAEMLYLVAIAHAEKKINEENRKSYLQLAQIEIKEAILLINQFEEGLKNKTIDQTKLLIRYHEEALRIAGKLHDFAAVFEHHQEGIKHLATLKKLVKNFEYDDELYHWDFRLTKLLRHPDAALTLAKQLSEEKTKLESANQQIDLLTAEKAKLKIELQKFKPQPEIVPPKKVQPPQKLFERSLTNNKPGPSGRPVKLTI